MYVYELCRVFMEMMFFCVTSFKSTTNNYKNEMVSIMQSHKTYLTDSTEVLHKAGLYTQE